MTSGRRATSKAESWLPLIYFALALVLVVAILPTVLRQPPPEQNQTAELSPDAPPDEDQQSIISSLSRATTGTAGEGEGTGVAPGEAAVGAAGPGGHVPGARACPRGFGSPPRQTESLYSPPCAMAFSGSNGGTTFRGVSGTEIKVGVDVAISSAETSYEGPVHTSPQPNETAVDRTYRVWQQWANQTFQLYGRQLRLYSMKAPAGGAEAASRNYASGFQRTHQLFATNTGGNQHICDEYERLKTVNFCDLARGPVTWSWRMDLERMTRFTAEYMCKSLVNRPAAFTDDPLLAGQPRRIGLVTTDSTKTAESASLFPKYLKEQCGAESEAPMFVNADSNDFGSAVSRLRTAGVTTVVFYIDWVTGAAFTNTMAAQAYYPEIFIPGTGVLDNTSLAKVQNQRIWRNAFGLSSMEMAHPPESTDCYRAFKEVDPVNEPNFSLCDRIFPSLLQMLAGMQMAGPTLNPKTFEQGLFSVGYRFYGAPTWAIGGGYGPGDYSYAKDVVEIWWDADEPQPDIGDNNTGTPGTYRYVHDGRRFQVGQLPHDESGRMFAEGVTISE